MSKKPLITRQTLRERREQEDGSKEKFRPEPNRSVRQEEKQGKTFHISRRQAVPTQAITDKETQKEFHREEKKINSFYRKEKKKNKPLKKSRTVENQKSRELNGFLVGAIIIVSLLIVVVMLATFFL